MLKDTEDKAKTVLISGAGIAGPALAYWLTKYGFNVTIIEKASAIRNEGYAIDFRGNAIKVLEEMGILDEVKKLQTHTGAVYFVNRDGTKLASMPSIFLSGELEIMRGDLGKILYDLTKHSTEYIFGDSITSINETDEGVAISFEKNKTRTFSFVVGADGAHSTVRSLVFGDETQFIRHLGYGISVFSIKNYLRLNHTGLFFATPGKLAAVYSARDINEAKVMFYFDFPQTHSFAHDKKLQKEILEGIFTGQGWQIPKLLAEMKNSPDFYFDTIDQIRMPKWSKGRVVLLGDAAYCASPLSGMGTGLAITGAYILARELRQADNKFAAFETYEQKMRPYVRRAQFIPQLLGPLTVPRSYILIHLRIFILRLIEHLKLERLILILARQPSESVKLKEY